MMAKCVGKGYNTRKGKQSSLMQNTISYFVQDNQSMKFNKSPGEDGILSEFIKYTG